MRHRLHCPPPSSGTPSLGPRYPAKYPLKTYHKYTLSTFTIPPMSFPRYGVVFEFYTRKNIYQLFVFYSNEWISFLVLFLLKMPFDVKNVVFINMKLAAALTMKLLLFIWFALIFIRWRIINIEWYIDFDFFFTGNIIFINF